MSLIYLDNNATTSVDPQVIAAILPFFAEKFANANSTHRFGVEASEAVKTARKQVADLIGAETSEIIFTSGATEAINIGIKGVVDIKSQPMKHIVTVATEHSAVLDTCKYLETKGVLVTYLPVKPDGLIDLDILKTSIKAETILVTVMHVNNETGVIQPIREISEICRQAGVLFMTDATQSVGKLAINVYEMGVDLLCFSGHKIYAPKGIGVLFVRQRFPHKVKINPLMHGGGHERGIRSGTLNVPGIVGIGKACEIAKNEMTETSKRILALRDLLETGLLKIQNTNINGSLAQRLHNVTNIWFKDVDSDALIIGLSKGGNESEMIAVSNGSACTSTSIEPSHVLTAMQIDEARAFSSIRFSIGKFNTQNEIELVIQRISEIVKELRAMI